ncbi:cell wall hydrolase [Bacillus solimangrovi]|uniref:Spore cortex-lytic enzyme n=1 Tax=Bacillus solimangrovi TaxID=1305675 RepID=A0A1E5LFF5_9BACI|nr:cell wall hydrolase [Bacillus solimangrovi]OEH92802.1 spore cortex-lytic enzyme [Bacillus solimangrovi]
MKFKKLLTSITVATLLAGGSFTIYPIETNAQAMPTKPVLQEGNTDGFVWDLQHRLNQLNIYQGPINGVFGPNTEESVYMFQKQYGLTIDGVVGPNTWDALYRQTFTASEIDALAKVVYGEARGESMEGQVAVAAVVLNRTKSSEFPDTVNDVIFEPRQFTAVADGQYYLTPNEEAYKAVYYAIQGWDPTEEAIYYFNPDTAESDWLYSREKIKRIGEHVFLK